MVRSMMNMILDAGGGYEMDEDNYSLSNALEKNTRYKMNIWISEPINGAKYIVNVNTIVYL